MDPVENIMPGVDIPLTVYAKNQPPYIPLPAYKEEDGTVTTRWRLTFKERVQVLLGGHIWVTLLTFNKPLQPITLTAECPLKVAEN
jgi:hypothetical protein